MITLATLLHNYDSEGQKDIQSILRFLLNLCVSLPNSVVKVKDLWRYSLKK